MSGWMIMTLRAAVSGINNRSQNEADLAASLENDDRVRKWTGGPRGHVYAYLNGYRGDFRGATDILQEYAGMVEDAALLAANNTTDTGECRYYVPEEGRRPVDGYEETQGDDGVMIGRIAAAKITARQGILVDDPWHYHDVGIFDEEYAESGTDRITGAAE